MSVSEKKIISDEELAEMGKRTLDLLSAAIDEGNSKQARGLAKRMYAEFLAMHDLYRDWVTDLASFIARRNGDDVACEALRETVQHYSDNLGPIYADKTDTDRIRMLAAGLRGHLQEFEVREDERGFEIIATTCGSGGRLIASGGYQGENAFRQINGPSQATFGRDKFPIYCSHCHFQNEVIPAGMDAPLFETIPSDDLGRKPCRLRMSKRDTHTETQGKSDGT